MKLLLHPTYFPNIASCIAMAKAEAVCLEFQDNYQKQTYRNRTHIYAANGVLALTIPVVYSQKNRSLYRDIKIANSEHWQAHHWKSLLSAYSTSPYFEFYKDDLAPLFHKNHEYLLAFNIHCLEVLKDCLQWDLMYTKTSVFDKVPKALLDKRYLVNARKEKKTEIVPYTQVFSDKYGFLHNLSILDLLFNEGPNTLSYLESQVLFNDLNAL